MATDASQVIYTGVPVASIPITPSQNLQLILQNIATAITNVSGAPNYSGYNLYCITQTDGSTHPTNTQNFAEGISKIVCDNAAIVTTFIGTTYVANQAVISGAITDIVAPAYTYAPFSITSADSLDTVFSKMFTGFTGYNTALNPSSADWASLSITPPTTVTTGFGSLLTYIGTMNTTIAGKQASLGTFDNSANCLGGGATDTALQTINYIRTYICTLPEFTAAAVTTTCLSTQSDLQDWVQHIVTTIDGMMTEYVGVAGTGLSYTAGTSCNPATLAIDPTYTGLRKVGLSSADSTYGYLEDKTKGGTGITLTQVSDGGFNKILITNNSPADGKVLINASDSAANYLENKLIGAYDPVWGMRINNSVGGSNAYLETTPTISEPTLFATQLLSYIGSDPSLRAILQTLANPDAGSCAAVDDLVVVLDGSDFELTWTPASGATGQTAKWRQKGQVSWQTSRTTPANNQTAGATTADIDLSSATNVVYQFQVDNICSEGTSNGNIYEYVQYDYLTLTGTPSSGQIVVSQSPIALDEIEYIVYTKTPKTPVAGDKVPGSNPIKVFTGLAADTYLVEYRYSTVINGVTLYSDDAGQLGAWGTTGDIVVP